MFCSYCKGKVKETDSICLKCGKNINNVKNETEYVCSGCGNDIPEDAVYCWNCGLLLEKDDQVLSEQSFNDLEASETKVSNDKEEANIVESFRKDKDWFIEIEKNIDAKTFYGKEEILTQLRTNILEGKHSRESGVVIHQKDKNGNWQQTESTLYKLAVNHFKLRVLYQPVWSHAIAGLKWGAIVGIGLKLLDTLILLGSVDPALAFFFLAAIGVVFIPRIGMIGVVAVVILSMKYTRANFFLMGLTAALVGAALGCLPGMAIGGIIGLSRKESFSLAKDALPEPEGIVLKAVILPLISGIAVIAFYILIINQWIMSILE